MNMDLLLFYIREDGLFARLILHGDSGLRRSEAERTEVTEETLPTLLGGLFARITEGDVIRGRRLTVVYALSRKIEVWKPCVAEVLRGLSVTDSISLLPRDELFYRGVLLRSKETPHQILYCDSRETRLFTPEGEFFLDENRVTGGNGFLDFLLGFAKREGESQEYFLRQSDRLKELFSIYRCFSDPSLRGMKCSAEIFPNREKHPNLTARPVLSESIEISESGIVMIRKRKKRAVSHEDEEDLPIHYAALSKSDRERVDRRYPALYRAVRDHRGNYKHITIGEAATAFAALFGCIHEAPLTDLIVVGQYARYPLTEDFVWGLPQKPTISFESESLLLLDAMEDAATERIRSSRLSLSDIDGEEIVLWNAEEHCCTEKRVCFAATLKRQISREEWRKKMPQLPYLITIEELIPKEDGSFVRSSVLRTGDLREFCYRRMKDGSYRLRLPEAENNDSAFRPVLIGIGATPCGICCRLLSDTKIL